MWDDGVADEADTIRPAYLVEHLLAIHAAIASGVRVLGYVFWTISDNWEWADGYCPKFGLAAVNRTHPAMPRVPRESYAFFSALVRARAIRASQRSDERRARSKSTMVALTRALTLLARFEEQTRQEQRRKLQPMIAGDDSGPYDEINDDE